MAYIKSSKPPTLTDFGLPEMMMPYGPEITSRPEYKLYQEAVAKWGETQPDTTENVVVSPQDAGAAYEAKTNSPSWQKAVKDYNAGIPQTDKGFDKLLRKLNSYYTGGEASSGRLVPELAAQAIERWGIDAQPSPGYQFMDNVIVPLATTALLGGAAYAAFPTLLGGAAGGADAAAAADMAGGMGGVPGSAEFLTSDAYTTAMANWAGADAASAAAAGGAGGGGNWWDNIFGNAAGNAAGGAAGGARGGAGGDAMKKIAGGAGASWLDYLSTGLGLTQAIKGARGGNSQDAGAAQRATDPFAPYRAQYAQQLNQLMVDPSSVTSLPGYKFKQQQGQQAIERQLSSQGRTVSGQEQLELQKYGQDLAGQTYTDQYNKLAQLSGATQGPGAGGAAFIAANDYNQKQRDSGWGQLGDFASGAMTPNNPINRAVTGTGNFLSNLWR